MPSAMLGVVVEGIGRRQLMAGAAALGASFVACRVQPRASNVASRERRDLYPEGVASGDPDHESVLLWTRRPFSDGRGEAPLGVEVAEDPSFTRVVASSRLRVSAASDWTCRVLVGGLAAARTYWYRFTDSDGFGSRVGRTRTAPLPDDPRPVRFAFVSCQNVNQGAQNAYRRMIHEDEQAAESERLDFVLHLGDFIYELVWYPEDRPQGMYDRRLRDIVRYASGEKIEDFHVPTTVDDYRAVYRAYLRDVDLQDARARWPFVAMQDNHEFSWLGWQGLQVFDGRTRPAQTRKVAANQAWFEYQPARVKKPGVSLETFEPPHVVDAPVTAFDAEGLGMEPNNLAAIGSLTAYRALRWGKHVELILTDQHSYRSEDFANGPEGAALVSKEFPELVPQPTLEALDAKHAQTILGREQKAWFLERLRASHATWKIWGNSQGTLDGRADPANLPPELAGTWSKDAYAIFGPGDWATAYRERAEIYEAIAQARITGFATVSGDRHSFWAGLAAKALPPRAFDPVGIAFVTGSISAPGVVEAFEHAFPKDHPLRALFLAQPPGASRPLPAINLLMRHGVRACLEYQRTGDLSRARALANPDLAPHLSFLDMGGHGYAVARISGEAFECEFVCIPRPLERSDREDGGPLVYRVVHRVAFWAAGERPGLSSRVLEGDPGLSI